VLGKVEAASLPLSAVLGIQGTAASESGVGGRENTKHNTNTFGATSATALQKRRRSSVESIFSDRLADFRAGLIPSAATSDNLRYEHPNTLHLK
jgi:hypothetical protein